MDQHITRYGMYLCITGEMDLSTNLTSANCMITGWIEEALVLKQCYHVQL